MQLTRLQRQVLSYYQEYRQEGGPTVRGILRSWANYVLICSGAAIAMLSAAFLSLIGNDPTFLIAISSLVGGMMLGLVLRDLRNYSQFIWLWPAFVEIVDWNRLEELLDDSV